MFWCQKEKGKGVGKVLLVRIRCGEVCARLPSDGLRQMEVALWAPLQMHVHHHVFGCLVE